MSHLISLINLGCNKNLVDSQLFLWKFLTSDHEDVDYSIDPYDPEVELVFLNTCGFISSGREEMFQTIKKLLSHQKKICIIGCAVQVYEKLLKECTDKLDCIMHPQWQEIKYEKENRETIAQHPNISFLSRNDLQTVTISEILQQYKSQIFNEFEWLDNPRALTNIDNKFEYLKIAEWCNNSCSFCIIPQIRGGQKSLPIEKILEEVKMLVHQWAEEIIFIAQDSTRYGMDIYGKPQLFELLEQIENISWNFRYRLLYLYPDILTLSHLKKLTTFKKFIPYFDIPLQHISSSLLKSMRRFYDEQSIHEFLDFIKTNFHQYFIRSNFIIGFPGETDSDFQQLYDFLAQNHFDNVALFEYHDEPLAPSSQLPNKVPDNLIHKRFKKIRKMVDSLLSQKQQDRKWKKFTGYVQEIKQHNHQLFLSIRPVLYCPEIDEQDDIQPSQIISSEDKEIQIGSKVVYTL